MATRTIALPAARVWHARPDRRLAWLALGHATLLWLVPSPVVIALGMWWNANTISHNFIHRPFYRSRGANRTFSLLLTLLLGVPQSYWRERHLQHHADRTRRVRVTWTMAAEVLLLGALWIVLANSARTFLLASYVPGLAAGLGLCWLQGHYEHARGTTSHYGRLYNWLFFNDGYHAEHHERPGVHWAELPSFARASRSSRWPPILRWLDGLSLEGLERFALRSPALRGFLLRRHTPAFRQLLPRVGPVRRVLVVGGGLFPRTALILRDLLPEAAITVLDESAENLEIARPALESSVTLIHARFDRARCGGADLVVVPLDFHGDRDRIYRCPPAPAVIVHDWIWAGSAPGVRVSWLLLKRLNLVIR